MARAQNSSRGRFTKKAVDVAASGGILFSDYSTSSNLLTSNTTALVVAGQVRVNNAKYIGANSTGFLFSVKAAKPTTRTAGYNWTFITNSTGVSGISVRTTGTTWKYLNVTSVLPT